MSIPRSDTQSEPQADKERLLTAIYAPIRDEMLRFEMSMATELTSESEGIQSLLAHVSRYRGKRLRPALVQLVGKAAGQHGEDHIALGVVLELIHTATLIHDDILDGASTRRGIETLNQIYSYDVPVLLGDHIYAKAFCLATHLEDRVAASFISEVTSLTCRGEIEQIFSRWNFDIEESRYLKIIEEKTGCLYAGSTYLGAHYAGASTDVSDAFRRYGLYLGIAFQIIDDCLDFTGSELVVGKSLGTDLEKGKITLPLIHLLSKLSPAEKERLKGLLKDETTDADQKRIRVQEEFELGASLAYAQNRADNYIQKALGVLPPLPKSPALDSLQQIGQYVLERER